MKIAFNTQRLLVASLAGLAGIVYSSIPGLQVGPQKGNGKKPSFLYAIDSNGSCTDSVIYEDETFYAGKFDRPVTLAVWESGTYIPVFQWHPLIGKSSKDTTNAKNTSETINWNIKFHLPQTTLQQAIADYHRKKAEEIRIARELFEKRTVDSLYRLTKTDEKDHLEYFSRLVVDAGLAHSSAMEPYQTMLSGYYTQRIANGLIITEVNRKYIAPFYFHAGSTYAMHTSKSHLHREEGEIRTYKEPKVASEVFSKSSKISSKPAYSRGLMDGYEHETKSVSDEVKTTEIDEPTVLTSMAPERKFKLSEGADDAVLDEKHKSTPKETGMASSVAPGQITAGIWNDVEHWDAFKTTHEDPSIASIALRWGMRFNRQLIKLSDKHGKPLTDATVQLFNEENRLIWTCKTDNRGLAVLYMDFRGPLESNGSVYRNLPVTAVPVEEPSVVKIQKSTPAVKPSVRTGKLVIVKNEQVFEKKNWKLIPNIAAEELQLNNFNTEVNRSIDICLVVDATGSMGDELHYLKSEMMDVIMRAQSASPCAKFRFSSVFYRDLGDAYVTVSKPFTDRVDDVIEYVNQQSVGGGGDFPEAMDSAMAVAVNGMEWSTQAISRIIFLVLDAPAHDYAAQRLRETIEKAAKLGIKIIPIAASGIDKNCEFLFKYMATATYGDYVYITDHSGIGNSHLKPTGIKENKQYLNDLMVELISKYSQFEGCDNQTPTQMEPRVELFGDQSIQIQAFPNPAISDLSIQCNEVIEWAELTTLDGRVVKKFENIRSKNTYVSVDGLTAGIYILRCQIAQSSIVYTTKIMAMPAGQQSASQRSQ